MIAEFLTPAKFPRQWSKQKEATGTYLTINFRSKRFAFSIGLTKALKVLCTDFTQIQILVTQEVGEDKAMITKYFIVPCQKGGWVLSIKNKAQVYSFINKGLIKHLQTAWNITEEQYLLKIPVFTEPLVVKEAKCLEINLKHIQNDAKQ